MRVLNTFFIPLFALWILQTRAQDSLSEIRTSASNFSILIGQRLEVYFDIPKNKSIMYPDIQDEVFGFTVLSTWDTVSSDENSIYISLALTRFDTGYSEFKSLGFIIDNDTIYSGSLRIYVGLPDLSENIEIFDIKPNIYYYDDRWILAVISLIIFVIVIYYIVKKYNFIKKMFTTRKIEPILALEDEIFEKISHQRQLYNTGKISERELYYRVDELIRYFLEIKYTKKFLESTTKEVRKMLLNLPLSIYFIESLQDFFSKAEIVKFAKGNMDPSSTDIVIEKLLEFLKSEKFNPFEDKELTNAQKSKEI